MSYKALSDITLVAFTPRPKKLCVHTQDKLMFKFLSHLIDGYTNMMRFVINTNMFSDFNVKQIMLTR